MLSSNPTLTFGRMDELLLHYYRHDLQEGRLTPDDAGDLIEDFYCKHNLILGRGEHQMSGGSEKATGWFRNLTYDAPQYVVLAGRRTDNSGPSNELTVLFLERIVPRFENPVVVLRYTPDLPDGTWTLACNKMRANASFMVYNDENVIPAMVRSGIDPQDAVTYTMHGCNWPDIPGTQRTLNTMFVNLPDTLRGVLLEADGSIDAIDEVYDRFAAGIGKQIDEVCDGFRSARAAWEENAPGALRVDDCFLDGPVERARSWTLGGVKYPNVVCAPCGLASAADGFAALDDLVFRIGTVSLNALSDAVETDFEGQEPLRQRSLSAPKFGRDDDRADAHAVRVMQTVQREIDRASRRGSDDEVGVFHCPETDMRHIRFGKDVGATPDGRRARQPISENTSPYPGSCTKGLTAMLRSLAKLPFHCVNSGALNVRIPPRLFAGPEGLEKLAALLRTYFDMGGLQIQLSFADVEELRCAQADPETYRDLMVRITGYSAAFVDMSRQAQDEIIRREEMEN
jgi:formate C-acetyltransferase